MDTDSDASLALPLPLRVRAWGYTGADVEHALYKAAQGAAREPWQFAAEERLGGRVCPIDVQDPAAIAADQGYHWAYAVYREAP